MGSVPTAVNKTLGVVETVINAAAMKAIAPVLDRFIKSIPQLAFLNVWPLSSIVTFTINWICQKLSVVFQYLGVRIVLNIQTDAERSACESAEHDLRAALSSGDPNAVQEHSHKFDDAYGSLIHWDGSSPVIK